MTLRRLDSLTAPELRNAVAAYVKGNEYWPTESWSLAGPVASALGCDINDAESLGARGVKTYQFHIAQERFFARVRRTADWLAEHGALARVGRGQYGPDGHCSNYVRYYTLEQYAQAQQAQEKWMADAQARTERWTRIRQRLADGPGVQLNDSLTLLPEHWESLLDQAGW